MKFLLCNKYRVYILVILFCNLGCNKKNEDQAISYNITFKVNGIKNVCTKHLVAKLDTFNIGSTYILGLGGLSDTCSVSISLETTSPITDGSFYSDNSNGNAKVIGITYAGQNGQIYDNGGIGSPNIHLQIQQINEKLIKGTFSGNTMDATNKPDFRNITEGSFVLPLE